MQTLSPLVKWAGGKRAVLPGTLPFFPSSYKRYVEPFLGGGAFLWFLQPQRSLAADVNAELINLYDVVRDQPVPLMRALDELAAGYDAAPREFYLRLRTTYNDARDMQGSSHGLEQAARFLFINKTCFNGLYRVNRSGAFNVPFGGREEAPQLYDRENLLGISGYLGQRGVSVVRSDFRPILAECGKGDLIYADPPYIHDKSFTNYNADAFLRSDYEEMIELLHAAHRKGATVVLSNSLNDRELFRGFTQHIMERSTSVSGFKAARVKSPEYIYCLL